MVVNEMLLKFLGRRLHLCETCDRLSFRDVPGVTIVKPNSLHTSVTGITKAGQYTITLAVTDADGDSDSDKVVITVKEGAYYSTLFGYRLSRCANPLCVFYSLLYETEWQFS